MLPVLSQPASPASPPRPPLRWPVLVGLAAILLVGTLLRVWGAGAGAPFRMGVDEPVIVSNALRMIKTGDFSFIVFTG